MSESGQSVTLMDLSRPSMLSPLARPRSSGSSVAIVAHKGTVPPIRKGEKRSREGLEEVFLVVHV